MSQIPTYLIAGPLGAGKTTLLQQLLRQRPANEHWAILINEFGQLGLDAALLDQGRQQGISLAEIPGGCLCCVNGLPFQVGLQRLLKRSRPQRLLIETSGLGHPASLFAQLQQAPWQEVLALQPLIMVLDAAALAAGQPLPDSQLASLPLAGCLLLNKSAQLDASQREKVLSRLPAIPSHWTEQAQLDWSLIPGAGHPVRPTSTPDTASYRDKPAALIWRDLRDIHGLQQQQGQMHSLSWRLHPTARLQRQKLHAWLARINWLRAKARIQDESGWFSLNAVAGQPLVWSDTAPGKDQRIELICAEAQDQATLTSALRAAVITG